MDLIQSNRGDDMGLIQSTKAPEVEVEGETLFVEQELLVVVERCRGGLVFKAHRRVSHSTLGSRVIKKKKR